MVKIAYILLCHKDPESIIRQAIGLTAAGDFISIHFDARASAADFKKIKDGLADNPNVSYGKRLKCGWGEWSLVEASLNAIEAAEEAFPSATHFYMVSGDCMAIKPATYTHKFLEDRNFDFVECEDFFESDWIKVGLKEERLIYRHWFNERQQKTMFYTSLNLQQKLGIKRSVPNDIEMRIGSQWWCLRRKTIEAILQFTKQRRDVMSFFKTTWIPDETFFQTLVCHLVPEEEIEARTLTFLMFSDYGMPVTFFNDQYELLLSQEHLFARKISTHATDLKERLSKLYSGPDVDLNITSEGRQLYGYLTKRGRDGRRYAQRFWEKEASIGRERELLIIICKKWHVAKRFLNAAKEHLGVNGVGYLFDEAGTSLPNVGGIEKTLEKRARHRRSFVRMIYEDMATDRLIVCLDPSNIDVLDDFYGDRATIKTMEIACSFTNDYIRGHAIRSGIANENSSEDALARLVPTVRQDLAFESDRIRDRNFPHLYSISDKHSPEDNMMQISAFLDIGEEKARHIAETPYLFSD
ncbi:beta-1,6-N-acetylglucosaminyltransferase [Amylibacter sp. SFDW26]|uniref:DUF5928 domain-containing protein n=1 Tax=Amylibacter sp. SFDW26 TaxID=2652722 RepID=UPI001261A669|nr:DUF5928 domain-containing protein [Amylibacter sp. SFDW26]KAB7613889.1 beta-1,6-N-acetylglucosaminyltransferase [Amylibacter sp. SFDW26]